MTSQPKKLTRKQLHLKEDGFLNTMDRITNYVQTSQKQLIFIGVAALVALLLAWGTSKYLKNSTNNALALDVQAQNELAKALTFSPTEEPAANKKDLLQQALQKYEILNKKFYWTTAHKNAPYYIAVCHLHLEDYAKASDEFQRFLKSSTNSDLKGFAEMNLGQCYDIQKEYQKAVEHYKNALNYLDSRISDAVLMALGSCYEALGNQEEALKAYELVKTHKGGGDEEGDSAFLQDAESRYQELQAKMATVKAVS